MTIPLIPITYYVIFYRLTFLNTVVLNTVSTGKFKGIGIICLLIYSGAVKIVLSNSGRKCIRECLDSISSVFSVYAGMGEQGETVLYSIVLYLRPIPIFNVDCN